MLDPCNLPPETLPEHPLTPRELEVLAEVLAMVATLAGSLQQQSERSAPGDRPEDLLSRRELEILALIAEGATNAEIAERFVIATSTVQSHVKNILRKLEVRNRTQAAARYLCP
jgi:LuxR family transcriptional regulator, regulator of acetate metabolism